MKQHTDISHKKSFCLRQADDNLWKMSFFRVFLLWQGTWYWFKIDVDNGFDNNDCPEVVDEILCRNFFFGPESSYSESDTNQRQSLEVDESSKSNDCLEVIDEILWNFFFLCLLTLTWNWSVIQDNSQRVVMKVATAMILLK